MENMIEAACGCETGRIRSNNEDNLFYYNRILPEVHQGIGGTIKVRMRITDDTAFAVFDGMGGEQMGEKASFYAAETFREEIKKLKEFVIAPHLFLNNVCEVMNRRICEYAAQLRLRQSGSTAAILLFTEEERFYACNLGDSRIYRLRDNRFMQLSVDDVQHGAPGSRQRKALTQHLGIPPDEIKLTPHITTGDIRIGDVFLLCSDGLTDMLSNFDIYSILAESISTKRYVDKLMAQAMQRGGKDNTTVLAIRVLR